jgi:hypothetical protein
MPVPDGTRTAALAGRVQWSQSKDVPRRVRDAIKYFYRDGTIPGFRPDVVDSLSALRTYIDVGAGVEQEDAVLRQAAVHLGQGNNQQRKNDLPRVRKLAAMGSPWC